MARGEGDSALLAPPECRPAEISRVHTYSYATTPKAFCSVTGLTGIYAHLMSVCPNALVLEYFPAWFDQLYEEPPLIRQGTMHLTNRLGLGRRFSEDVKRRLGNDDGAVVRR